MDKEIDKFIEDYLTTHLIQSMFDINEVEEDLVAGKPFSKLKEDLATTKKEKRKLMKTFKQHIKEYKGYVAKILVLLDIQDSIEDGSVGVHNIHEPAVLQRVNVLLDLLVKENI